MKKIITLLMFLLMIVTAGLVTVGCDNTTGDIINEIPLPLNDTSGVMVLSGSESGVFKEQFLYPGTETKEEIINSSKISEINIGGSVFKARQTKTIYNEDKTVTNVYCSEDGKYEYWINDNNNSFCISSVKDAVLQDYTSEELSEDKLLTQIKNYIISILPNEHLDRYTQSCSTKVIVQNPDSAWAENKDHFYMPEAENETVESFILVFRLFDQGLRTSDNITVSCNASGDLQRIEYHNHGVDWSSQTIEAESIRKRAISFAAEAVSDEYVLKNVSVSTETLTVYDSKIMAIVECELTLEHNGSEIAVLCPLIMDL